MFIISDQRQRESVLSMLRALQEQYEECESLLNSRAVRINDTISKITRCLKMRNLKSIKNFLSVKYYTFMINKNTQSFFRGNCYISYSDADYFISDRIAVYTAVFGNYESIHEPKIVPDNIDYYIVTDCPMSSKSQWKIISVDLPPKLNAAQKNRYVKMHPQLLFPNYKYSIYVDGSIQIISDLTPLVHRIGQYGFAVHRHSIRDDVYDELIAVKYTKKITNEKYEQYITFLREQKMPRFYGLVECGVIARKHSNSLCIQIMEEWWEQYLNGVNRDQICLAYVLFKNNIEMNEINTLGSNIYKNCLFKVMLHK